MNCFLSQTTPQPPPTAGQTLIPTFPQKVKLVLPAFYRDRDHQLQTVAQAQDAEFRDYLKYDLDVHRLNKIHKHLWYAGLPQNARALHHQLVIEREVTLTEVADLHLLWQDNRLFLKALPEYLCCHAIWENFLCKERALYEDANGFLLSYLWLIRHNSDLTIAHDKGLLNKDTTWERWTGFMQVVFSKLDHKTLVSISPQYLYGELRWGRVNTIYRFCAKTTSFTILIHGYE